MGNNEVTITGLDEIQKLLNRLPANIEANVMRGALRAGVKVIETEAKTRVPVKTGKLLKSIRISSRKRGSELKVTLKAGGKGAKHAHLVEFGTQPHVINAKPESVLEFLQGIFAKTVMHPGARMKPFMRPALDAGRHLALREMAAYARKRVNKELLKK